MFIANQIGVSQPIITPCSIYSGISPSVGNDLADIENAQMKADKENSQLDVESIEETEIPKVFPNPFEDIVKIEFSKSGKYSVSIVNLHGESYYYTEPDNLGSNFVIDLSFLSFGIYFLQLVNVDSSESYIKKLIKR